MPMFLPASHGKRALPQFDQAAASLAPGSPVGLVRRSTLRAASLVELIEVRGMSLSDEQRVRILGCSDIARLRRWAARAVTAQSTTDAISED
jgi:hypothetical protein